MMQPSTRRTVSCVATTAVLIGLGVGYTRLPGAGGVVGELRWLVDQPDFYVQHCNHAGLLLRQAEQQEPGASARIFSALLADSNRRRVGHALMLLADQLKLQSRENRRPDTTLQSVFDAWFSRTSVEEKVALGTPVFDCACLACVGHEHPGLDNLPITQDDHRWLVAGTLPRWDNEGFQTVFLVFDSPGIAERLWFIDFGMFMRFEHSSMRRLFVDNVPFTPIDAETLREHLRLGVDEIVAMLSDPIPEVRWAAGRILTVAGDERGLPAFCEWLESSPRVDLQTLDKLMSDLFGPDWRKRCESSGAARP